MKCIPSDQTTTGAHGSLGPGSHIAMTKPHCAVQRQLRSFVEMVLLAVDVKTTDPLQVHEYRTRRNVPAPPQPHDFFLTPVEKYDRVTHNQMDA
jgi:hypothetical protein